MAADFVLAANDILENITQLVPTWWENMKPKIIEVLPMIVDAVKPAVIEIGKELIDYYKQSQEPTRNIPSVNTTKDEFIEFREKNRTYLDKKLVEREALYYKYARCESLVDLYNSYLKEQPVYIPAKFRKDDFAVMSREELDIVNKLDLNRLQAEIDLETLRQNRNRNKIFKIDEEIEKFIEDSTLSLEGTRKALSRWEEVINTDVKRIDKKRTEKVESTKKNSTKDREFYKKNQKSRVPKEDNKTTPPTRSDTTTPATTNNTIAKTPTTTNNENENNTIHNEEQDQAEAPTTIDNDNETITVNNGDQETPQEESSDNSKPKNEKVKPIPVKKKQPARGQSKS